MHIYQVNWTTFNGFGMCAAVIAKTEGEAISLLDLDNQLDTDAEAKLIGICESGELMPRVVASSTL